MTCDEWKQYVTSLFREADANHDGVLTREEYAALSRRDRLFETVGFDYWDANHDGRISLSETVDKLIRPSPCSTRTAIACSRLMSACSRAIPPKTRRRTPAVRRRRVAPAAVEPSQPHDRRPLCADRRVGHAARCHPGSRRSTCALISSIHKKISAPRRYLTPSWISCPSRN